MKKQALFQRTAGAVTFYAKGDFPLYLCYHGKGKTDLLDFTLLEGDE